MRVPFDAHSGVTGRSAVLSKPRRAWRLAEQPVNGQPPGARRVPLRQTGPHQPRQAQDTQSKGACATGLGELEPTTRVWVPSMARPAMPIIIRLARGWPEGKEWRMSLMLVRRVGCVPHGSRPATHSNYDLFGSGGRVLTHVGDRDESPNVQNVIGYCWKLVTLHTSGVHVCSSLCDRRARTGARV